MWENQKVIGRKLYYLTKSYGLDATVYESPRIKSLFTIKLKPKITDIKPIIRLSKQIIDRDCILYSLGNPLQIHYIYLMLN